MSFTAQLAAADRAAANLLGGAVIYETGAGVAVEVQGIFDEAYVRAEAGQPGVSSTGPAVFLALADLPSDPETDSPTITVDGTTYRVREVQKPGAGGVLILLHEA